jgi:hypothetical protein
MHRVLAAQVLTEYDLGSPTAWCPAFGIDAVRLMQHATTSDAHWCRLDNVLMLIRTALAAIAVAAIFMVWWRGPATLLLSFLLAAGAIGLGLTLTMWSLQKTRSWATAALEDGQAENIDDIPSTLKRALADLQKTNLITYAAITETPFIGSGVEVGRWVMPPVDISIGTKDSEGERRTPDSFQVRELHERLRLSAPHRMGLENIRVTNRLYVRGDIVEEAADLFIGDGLRPPSAVNDSWVQAGVETPAELARTYLCLEKALVGGNAVVTLFVRCSLQRSMLSYELAAYVLPPISAATARLPKSFEGLFGPDLAPLHGRTVTHATAIAARRTFFADLFFQTERGLDPVEAHERQLRTQYETLGEKRRFDYGALHSIREVIASPTIDDYYLSVDIQDCLLRMQRGERYSGNLSV